MTKIPRFIPGSYGGMAQNDDGNYVLLHDVEDLMEECLGHDKARAVIHEYFEVPEEA